MKTPYCTGCLNFISDINKDFVSNAIDGAREKDVREEKSEQKKEKKLRNSSNKKPFSKKKLKLRGSELKNRERCSRLKNKGKPFNNKIKCKTMIMTNWKAHVLVIISMPRKT